MYTHILVCTDKISMLYSMQILSMRSLKCFLDRLLTFQIITFSHIKNSIPEMPKVLYWVRQEDEFLS